MLGHSTPHEDVNVCSPSAGQKPGSASLTRAGFLRSGKGKPRSLHLGAEPGAGSSGSKGCVVRTTAAGAGTRVMPNPSAMPPHGGQKPSEETTGNRKRSR